MSLRVPVVIFALAAACDPSAEKVEALDARVTALETKLDEALADDAQAKAVAALTHRVDALESSLDGVAKTQTTSATNLDGLAERVDALETRTTKLEETEAGGDDGGSDTGTPSEGEIGVKECDDYIAMYRKCIDDKMPEAARETAKKALQASIDAWKSAAATESGREALDEACKTAQEAMKKVCAP